MRTPATAALAVLLASTTAYAQWRSHTPAQQAVTQSCNGQSLTLPFDDVSGIFFCSVAHVFYTGVTAGTGANSFSPSSNVTRQQMAAFLSGTMHQSVGRAAERLALRQNFYASGGFGASASLGVPVTGPMISDGEDLYVPTTTGVARVDGQSMDVIGFANNLGGAVHDLISLPGRIVALTDSSVYFVNPVSMSVSLLQGSMSGNRRLAFDGSTFWILSLTHLRLLQNGNVTNIAATYNDIVFDGTHMWVTAPDNTIKKLNSDGSVALSVPVGSDPRRPVFDGTNIWVPNQGSNSITILRTNGTVVGTLTPSGMDQPLDLAFDGERIAVIAGATIYFHRAMDFAPLTSLSTFQPATAVSTDGRSFYVAIDTGCCHTVWKF